MFHRLKGCLFLNARTEARPSAVPSGIEIMGIEAFFCSYREVGEEAERARMKVTDCHSVYHTGSLHKATCDFLFYIHLGNTEL